MKIPSLTDKESTRSMPVATKKGKPRQPMIGMADCELHQRLRELLADHLPATYGSFRREHGISPILLETQISRYPGIFESGVELSTGRPTIKLKDGPLESREDFLMRETLVKKVRQAGPTGIRLLRLYMNTRIDSKTVQRLLSGVPDIAVSAAAGSKGTGLRRRSDLLYKWVVKSDDKESRIKDSVAADQVPEPLDGSLPAELDLEPTRRKLVVLCEKTHRHLSWLSNYLDPLLVQKVLARWPQDFQAKTVDLGIPDLVIHTERFPDAVYR
jgi:hypothetical protein